MLIVVSPAKSLDYETKLPTKKHSEPRLLDRSEELVDAMASRSPQAIAKLMSVSTELAELNHERFQDWHRPFTPANARPALLAFSGDVYLGMDAANTFTERDYTHAQKTLRILSGLYGVLRPLDLMQPYRLEMGTSLANPYGKDLYAFWGDQITTLLNDDLAASPGANVLVNLASNEYFHSVQSEKLDGRVVAPVFLDAKGNGPFKIVSFFAKRARGAMAGWMIRNRVTSLKDLTAFDELDYRYDPSQSTATQPVFTRTDGGVAAAKK